MSRRDGASVALVVALGAVAFAALVVVGGWWLTGRAHAGDEEVLTRVEQVGDRIAIVRVDGSGAAAAAAEARRDALRWSLVALGIGVVPLTAGALLWTHRARRKATVATVAPGDGAAVAAADELGRLLEDRERERRQLQEVVHELRTPLAIAATNLDLAATTDGIDDDLAAQLGAARRGVQRLARTVDDLALHGRLTASSGGASVDLAAQVRALAAEHQAPARLRRLVLRVDAHEPVAVASDAGAVHTAVGNLLSNALRLAPAGSTVELACGTSEDWAWIAVRDEGPGLAPADHERAFHRYWRGRYDLDRQSGEGTGGARGIGLTIARQLTEAQGGHVTVRSAVGVGSTFVVWLPRTTDAVTERVVAADGVHHRIDPMPARPLVATPLSV